MQRSISYFLFLSCLMSLTPLYAGTQTLTTYYPAPQGDYVNMEVNQVVTFATYGGATPGCPTASGGYVYLVDVNGVLNICDKNGQGAITANSLWTKGASGDYIETLQPENVGIGVWAADPGASGFALGVTGNAGVLGNTTLGTAGASPVNTLTVNGQANVYGGNIDIGNGGATVGNLLFQGSNGTMSYILMTNQGDQWTKIISKAGGQWNPTTLESSYGLDLTYAAGAISEEYGFRINNAITGTSVPVFEELDGNVGIGAPLTPGVAPAAKLVVNGQGNVGVGPVASLVYLTTPSIIACSSTGGNCGSLAVTQGTTCSTGGDCSYYAVYAQ